MRRRLLRERSICGQEGSPSLPLGVYERRNREAREPSGKARAPRPLLVGAASSRRRWCPAALQRLQVRSQALWRRKERPGARSKVVTAQQLRRCRMVAQASSSRQTDLHGEGRRGHLPREAGRAIRPGLAPGRPLARWPRHRYRRAFPWRPQYRVDARRYKNSRCATGNGIRKQEQLRRAVKEMRGTRTCTSRLVTRDRERRARKSLGSS
mmetsp:Transcript_35375/g.111294  ORF Transcript_35375/g.111294 Transcript_35375/m.111294 type:complete len:210 (+) Transcript_35375:661-1290(+)